MYHHTVSGLSNVKSTFDYGCGFHTHVKDYWKAKKILCYVNNHIWYAYHNDYKDHCGEGWSEEQAIDDLLILLDDGIR